MNTFFFLLINEKWSRLRFESRGWMLLYRVFTRHSSENLQPFFEFRKPLDKKTQTKEGCTLLETLTTLVYMIKFGFDKVRGGGYCNCDMEKEPVCLKKAKHYAAYYN